MMQLIVKAAFFSCSNNLFQVLSSLYLYLFVQIKVHVVCFPFICRHPIQELCCSPFIPNDIQSSGAHGKVKILTGPNACGKSVYLKQVSSF